MVLLLGLPACSPTPPASTTLTGTADEAPRAPAETAADTRRAGMTPVPLAESRCSQYAYVPSICHEWALPSGIRFVAQGDEDGIEYAFYRPTDGLYEAFVRVYPVLQDASRPDTLFWGYPWDITDIARPDDPERGDLLASFDHDILDDGVAESPAWQRRVPAVLFVGRTTQPQVTVAPLAFRPGTVPGLRSESER